MRDRHARHRRPDSDPRRRPIDGFRTRSAARFARLARDAVASLPPPLLRYLDSVDVAVEDLPAVGTDPAGQEIQLGAYRAGGGRATNGHPDQIILYRRPVEARAHNQQDLLEVLREALVHVLATHHGLSDEQLRDLGWR